MTPQGDPAALAARLDLDPDLNEADLTAALAVAASMLDPRCDQAKVDAHPDTYLEALYQLAVKVWDTRSRGAVSLDIEGGFDLSTTATSGLYRAVLGVAQPVLKQGGVIVG